jgi:virginiamycin A acetyltransferase
MSFVSTFSIKDCEAKNKIIDMLRKRNIRILRYNKSLPIKVALMSRIEGFVYFCCGNNLSTMGFLSYSFSQLDPSIFVGRYCSLAGNISVFGDKHPLDWATSNLCLYAPLIARDMKEFMGIDYTPVAFNRFEDPIMIGHDVWIGEGVTLKGGIKIGNGAVVGAKSVVTKDVPPFAIVAGNPARLIRFRFNERIIERFLELEPWRFNLLELSEIDPTNVEGFLDNFQEYTTRNEIRPISYKPITFNADLLVSVAPSNKESRCDYLRDLAVAYEGIDIKTSYQLMLSARELRPAGLFINEKLDEYSAALAYSAE